MKLVVDASVDYPLVALLRDARFDVTAVREVDPRMTDAAVLRLAVAESAALITADKDFGELAFHRGLQNDGIVL